MARPENDSTRGGAEKIGEFVRIYVRSGIWHVNFQFNKKQVRHSLGTSNKKQARRRAAQIDVKLTAGQWKPAIEIVTVGEAVELYLEMVEIKGRAAKTLTKYTQILGGHRGPRRQTRRPGSGGIG